MRGEKDMKNKDSLDDLPESTPEMRKLIRECVERDKEILKELAKH